MFQKFDITIQDLFALQATQSPDRIALAFGDQSLTYSELDSKSNQLANYLIRKGVGKETLVPICIERSFEMIIGILAIIKAGGAYVPIDPRYPKTRKLFILEDIGASFLLSDSKSKIDLTYEVLALDEIWTEVAKELKARPDVENIPISLAYIIYTSGSTGHPKGVMIENHAVCKYIMGQTKLFGITPNDKILQFSNFCFDASVEQIFLALLNGATLTLIDDDSIKDNEIFTRILNEGQISYLHATPGLLENLNPADFKSLKRVIAGGDICRKELAKKWAGYVDFYNEYGPTEITVAATAYLCSENTINDLTVIPIGKPLENMKVYILDHELQPVNDGEIGEIYIGGNRLARGYHNAPELTAKAFISNPFDENERIYKTGDIGKILPNKDILFLGRVDDQVKIRGHRIELAEIEIKLNQFEGIIQCIVLANNTSHGDKKLVAYYSSNATVDQQNIKKFLLKQLPTYMVPSIYVPIAMMPLTNNGKIDKKALQEIKLNRPPLASIYKKPKGSIEEHICQLWSDFLEMDKIGVDDNFFELGGDSLMAQRIIQVIKNVYPRVSLTKLYQFPTIGGLAQYLCKVDAIKNINLGEVKNGGDIAVIGMAGRFPGANTIGELWDMLIKGKEGITFFNEQSLDASIPDSFKNDPCYVKARGIIEGGDFFDPAFFGISPKLTELMDPQQRVFLEVAWEALEKSGQLSSRSNKKIGVFAGAGVNTYYENNVLGYPELIENQGRLQVNSVNDKDFVASRTSYHLNLKGPSVSINSACSTSLLAIAEAVNSLRAGQCEVALAGAASITSPINSGYLYQEGSMLSANGRCTPFNYNSTGTLFSDGAGVVVLKSLEAAKQDGDHIFAVIKGIGINNDGGGKGSFSAPSAEGQAEAIDCAIRDANINASEISYVEAHGTATPIGDPIEFDGLVEAFGPQKQQQYCAIGSIKSNIGHLTHAAGVAGFIKTCLALHHKMIPASLGFEKPNANIDFKNSPFYVNTKLAPWDDVKPRFAGVSSFGVGGTNVHVILEGYEDTLETDVNVLPFELIRLSALTENSLSKYEIVFADYLKHHQDQSLANLAYTLHTKRQAFKFRKFAVCDSTSQLADLLASPDVQTLDNNMLTEVPTEIVFSFPGQGAQYVNMGLALYQHVTVYKDAIDRCAKILENFLDKDIRTIIFDQEDLPLASKQLQDTRYTQPALFVTSYALAKLWMSWGVKPDLLIGHSVGEYVAAHLAGIFTLDDALKLVASRGMLISKLQGGSMLSIRHQVNAVQTLLTEDLSIAAINSPVHCVVSGPTEQIADFAKLLDQRSIANRPLSTSHAFHSSMMDPILPDFESIVAQVKLSRPTISIISTVTGEILSDEQATDINYWTTHLRNTVQFAKAVDSICSYNSPICLEVGPGTVTSTLIKQIAYSNKKNIKAIASLEPKQNALSSILNAMGKLWINGIDINWDAYYSSQKIVDVPTYQFDRKRYWLSPNQTNTKTYNTEVSINNSKTLLPNDIAIMRNENLTQEVKQVLEEASGIEMNGINTNQNFLEIGFDSLLLTQVATSLKRRFNLPITFRKLNEEYSTITALVNYLVANIPVQEAEQPKVIVEAQRVAALSQYNIQSPSANHTVTADNTALGLITQQLNILTQQLLLLQGQSSVNQMMPVTYPVSPRQAPEIIEPADAGLSKEEHVELQKPFGATPKIELKSTLITTQQQDFLRDLTLRYNRKTGKSKAYAIESRPYMADPRVVSGFKPATKELVYPIVINKSKGSKLWDLDGNEYIDTLNGFGSNMLGHQPDAIKEALHNQIENGYEVGPQHELAASVSKLICEFTGFDRSALCSTGSEAVLGCIRIARTVTARSLIVAFTGSYHGIIDEVLVRGTKKLKSFPAAAGIMPEAVQNILVLEYGTPETLEIIKERGEEIAAVLVETIQSRRPEFVPVNFLKELRTITRKTGSVLIFDEVITGFRFHPGGAQAIFDIKADLAAYGKVVGGGMPIGVIAGNRDLMDALDGGNWQYGDDSVPEVGVTYFAGTFVRHPLALSSALASLNYMKLKGPDLQKEINEKGVYLSKVLNEAFEKRKLPIFVANYGSLWKVKYHQEIPYSELMFVLLREKGIHILDGFPCFMTEATSAADIQLIINAFIESMDELIEIGFFPSEKQNTNLGAVVINGNNPPVSGAKLGVDEFGNPAWFSQDPENDEKYIQIDKI